MVFSFKYEFRKRYGSDFNAAVTELGKAERTLRRYYKEDKCDKTLEILLTLLNNTQVHPLWPDCYWLSDGTMETPYGICKPSDIAFAHRWKWHSHNSAEQIKRLKHENQDMDKYLEELQNQLLETIGFLASRKIS